MMTAWNPWKKGQLIGRVYAPIGDNGQHRLLLEVVAHGGSDENGQPLCQYRYLVSEEKRAAYAQDRLNCMTLEKCERE